MWAIEKHTLEEISTQNGPIFDISPYVFTQIPSERARWMRNLIPHPTNTTLHTFDRPRYPKNNKYLKKHDDDIIITFFQVFIVFGVAGSIKSMQCGYLLDLELNSTSNELSHTEFE